MLMDELKKIFTTLINECKEDKETFKAVHVKQSGRDDIDIIVNGKSSANSLTEKVMASKPTGSTLDVKRFGSTQVIIKIV